MVVFMKLYYRVMQVAVALGLIVSVSCSCDSSSNTLPPPSRGDSGSVESDMSVLYDYVRSYQTAYIRSLQLPSGAIKDNEAENSKITPYFAHFAALALLTEPTEQNLEVVKKYMSWYFGKLNGTSTQYNSNEIAGSVYDYVAPDETTKGTYDSVDSYAATFLELALRFSDTSDGCRNWLVGHKDELSLVAAAMIKTIDCQENTLPGENVNDFLSIAHYGYAVKYLMDNSEVNMGLRAAIGLKKAGLIETPSNLDALLSGNTAGIIGLYNESNSNYDYAKANPSTWSKFYPDATAQLYPCLFGAVPADDPRSKSVYEKFNSVFPDWPAGKAYSGYPWTMVAYAAAAMGDAKNVNAYITHIYGLNVKGEQKELWYDAEAGALLLAIEMIRNK